MCDTTALIAARKHRVVLRPLDQRAVFDIEAHRGTTASGILRVTDGFSGVEGGLCIAVMLIRNTAPQQLVV